MVPNPQGIGDDGQGGVDCRAGDEEPSVDDIQIVEVVGLAVEVEHRGLGICSKAHGAILVADAADGDLFPEIGQILKQTVADADVVEHMLELFLEALVPFDIVLGVAELEVTFARQCDAVVC